MKEDGRGGKKRGNHFGKAIEKVKKKRKEGKIREERLKGKEEGGEKRWGKGKKGSRVARRGEGKWEDE